MNKKIKPHQNFTGKVRLCNQTNSTVKIGIYICVSEQYVVKINSSIFPQLALLPNCQNPTLYNISESARHPKGAASHGGIYIPT